MKQRPNDGLAYLQDYPRLRKWINQCVACQELGNKPDMSVQIGPGVASQNLRRFFRAMWVNAAGLCEQCARAIQEKSD
jgi:hypothetical protein